LSRSLTIPHSTTHQQDIRGLQVAVDDATAVRVVDRLGQRSAQPGRGLKRDRLAALLDPGRQRQAGAIRRDHEADGAHLADLVDRHQVGMLQPRCGPRLPLKTLTEFGRQQHLGTRHLQRHLTAQERIVRQQYHPEAAAPQLATDPETAQVGPGHLGSRLGGGLWPGGGDVGGALQGPAHQWQIGQVAFPFAVQLVRGVA
jgi:hypothetical protein